MTPLRHTSLHTIHNHSTLPSVGEGPPVERQVKPALRLELAHGGDVEGVAPELHPLEALLQLSPQLTQLLVFEQVAGPEEADVEGLGLVHVGVVVVEDVHVLELLRRNHLLGQQRPQGPVHHPPQRTRHLLLRLQVDHRHFPALGVLVEAGEVADAAEPHRPLPQQPPQLRLEGLQQPHRLLLGGGVPEDQLEEGEVGEGGRVLFEAVGGVLGVPLEDSAEVLLEVGDGLGLEGAAEGQAGEVGEERPVPHDVLVLVHQSFYNCSTQTSLIWWCSQKVESISPSNQRNNCCLNIQAASQKSSPGLYARPIRQMNSYYSSTMQHDQPSAFQKLKADSLAPTHVESLCPRCSQNGTTSLLMLDIPMFREVLLASFSCPHCGESNREVQFAGKLPDLGIEVLFRCLHPEDLSREVIRSAHCTLHFEELDLTIPPKTAEITTIESLLRRSIDDLEFAQAERAKTDPAAHEKVGGFIGRLRDCAEGKRFPLSVKLRDPSGNSFIKNPHAPRRDKAMEVSHFRRSVEELVGMGYSVENAQEEVRAERQREEEEVGNKLNFEGPFEEEEFLKHEAVGFAVDCESCGLPGEMRSCRTGVPFFSDLLIMSFKCEYCGHHSTDTKNSAEVGDQALMIVLNADRPDDLKRELFKSETCYVNIPELELELDYGTLGGVYTTVQGLLEKIHEHLGDHNPFVDSDNEFGERMRELLRQLEQLREGVRPFTLMLVDPLARSFLENPYHPHQDRNARRDRRERTYEENETLGLNDINVDNYKQV